MLRDINNGYITERTERKLSKREKEREENMSMGQKSRQ